MNDIFFKALSSMAETCFINDKKRPFDEVKALSELVVSDGDIDDAAARLSRFAPFIKKSFPKRRKPTASSNLPLSRSTR